MYQLSAKLAQNYQVTALVIRAYSHNGRAPKRPRTKKAARPLQLAATKNVLNLRFNVHVMYLISSEYVVPVHVTEQWLKFEFTTFNLTYAQHVT